MPQTCVVNLDTIATVPRSVLHSRITRLTPARLSQVNRAVHFALGLPVPCTIT